MATGLVNQRDRFLSIRDGVSGEVERSMKLIKELLNELECTETLLRKTKFHLETECDQTQRLQQDVKQLKLLHETRGQRPFVVVLIDADADCYVFNDELIAKGESGGDEAADALLAVLQQFIKSLPDDLRAAEVVVKAFANLNGLGFALHRDKRIKDRELLRAFAAGFSSRQRFFDFVDVGSGKERADFKVQENMKFYLESFQCKHLILACGHDDGYAPWLGQFVGDKQVAERITLVEGSPFPPRMRSLGLKTIQFKSIFNNVGPQISSQTPPRLQTRAPGPMNTIRSQSGSPRQPTSHGAVEAKIPAGNNPAALSGRLGPVIVGDGGRRIDKPLHVNMAVSARIRKTSLCYYYYLRGQCITPCQRNHVYRALTHEEFDALWDQARQGRCTRSRKVDRKGGEDCSDPLCVYGHGSNIDVKV